MTRVERNGAFTLIELLIVVAIIAILAAIAVPNFLEAQTRSKVSRARADMRTIATGLEAYAVDNNDYPPNDGQYNVVPIELTTPVAFLSSSLLVDPFSDKISNATFGDLARYYTYTKVVYCEGLPAPQCEEFIQAMAANRPPPIESVDAQGFNLGALEKYGYWRLVSNGPDQTYSNVSFATVDPVLLGSDILYDPTNGTTSWGNLLRTQKDPVGTEKD